MKRHRNCTGQSDCDTCADIAESRAEQRHRDAEDDRLSSDGCDADWNWPRGFGGSEW